MRKFLLLLSLLGLTSSTYALAVTNSTDPISLEPLRLTKPVQKNGAGYTCDTINPNCDGTSGCYGHGVGTILSDDLVYYKPLYCTFSYFNGNSCGNFGTLKCIDDTGYSMPLCTGTVTGHWNSTVAACGY